MVHRLQNEGVKITKITGDQIRKNLPPAVPEQFVAAGEPLEDEVHIVGPLPFPNEVLMMINSKALGDDFFENVFVRGGEFTPTLKLSRSRSTIQGNPLRTGIEQF